MFVHALRRSLAFLIFRMSPAWPVRVYVYIHVSVRKSMYVCMYQTYTCIVSIYTYISMR